ncbi:MAG: DUF11 domain-containing protein, partial [Sphingobacteriales bacterium]
LFALLLLVNYQGFAQCTNAAARPDDGFQTEAWNPTCNGGTDGFIKITGITSSIASDPNANRPYSVRILTGVGGGIHPSYPTPFAIGNNNSFNLTNLPAGSYVIDIIDACGNTSSDKPVTLGQPANPEFTLSQPLIIRRITSPGGTCGDTFVVKVPFTRYETGQTLSVTFTNSANQTFTPTNNTYTIPRSAQTPTYIGDMIVEVPVSFFAGNTVITNLSSNQCSRPVQTKTIAFPPNFQVAPSNNFSNVQSTINTCISGYNITRTLSYGTANVSVTVVETNSPSTTALDINGNPLSFTYPPGYVWQDAIPIFSGMKYDVPYTITYKDACGLTVTEPLMIPSPAVSVASQTACTGPTQYSPFVDDAGPLGVTLPANLARSFPITFTITNGPATWTSTLGETTVNAPLSYPQVYTFNAPTPVGVFWLGTNTTVGNPASDNNIERGMQFAPGTYTIKYTDACGRTNTFTATVQGACVRNSTTSHTINYCGYTNGNVDLTHIVAAEDRDVRALYRINADNSETFVVTRTGAPFKFSNIPPGKYKVRFGGYNGVKVNYPGIGGLNGIPRLAGTNYIYEETIIVPPLTTLAFASLGSCNGVATGTATGGQAPYAYALYDATGTTIVRPTQTSGTFAGLTVGTTYQMQTIDACGRTFNQQISVINGLTAPIVGTVAQASCGSSNSIQISGLPSGTWKIVDSFNNASFVGTGASTVLTNLAPGTHTFTLVNDLGCSSPASASVILNATPTTFNLVITNPASACSPETVNLTLSAVTAGSDAGLTLSYFTDAAATLPLANPSAVATSGTYYIKAVSGSCTNIKPVDVTINNCILPILANDDTGTSVNSYAGGISVPNVLTNDKLNNLAVTASQVIISAVGTMPAGIVLNTTTGAVSVNPGTPVGTYNFTYKICEVANLTNCDDAVVTLEVVPPPCLSGSAAPILKNSANFVWGVRAYGIPCGSTTANLSAITASNKPASTHVILTWHSASPATDANRVDPVTAVTGSTRKIYAAFFDTAASCYSATTEIVIYSPICAELDDYTATPVIHGSTTTLTNSIYLNDTYNGSGFTMPNPNISILEELWDNRVTINPNGTLTVSPTLPPGTYNLLYKICDNDPDAIAASNCAVAEVIIKVIPSTDLSITKTVNNATPSVGSNVTFTITASNNGPSNATGVSVMESIPTGYEVVSVTPSIGSWTAPNWAIGNLSNGASATLTVVAKVKATGVYANTVTVSGNETDPTPGNNTDTEEPTPTAVSDLSITKTVNNATPSVGSNVTFTITATNNGPSNATGVSVAENIPTGYEVVSVTPSTGSWTAPNWAIGNLANGASATLTVVAKVKATGVYANTVTVSGNETDPTPGNNTDTEEPTPTAVSDLAITKTVNNATPSVGSNVTFTITATNNG